MYITKAAIMYSNGEIMYGRDYGHILYLANKLSLNGDKIEGFLTSTDEFVAPDRAARIAVEAGQVPETVTTLTPEHLWPEGIITE